MDRINELLEEIVIICESENYPFVAAYGRDRINMVDFQSEQTPDRIKKAIGTLTNGVKQAKRVIEIKERCVS